MEPEGSSSCSQKPTTCPYPEPDKSSPRPPNRHQIVVVVVVIIIIIIIIIIYFAACVKLNSEFYVETTQRDTSIQQQYMFLL